VIKITQRHWQAATREMRGDIGRQRAFAATTFSTYERNCRHNLKTMP